MARYVAKNALPPLTELLERRAHRSKHLHDYVEDIFCAIYDHDEAFNDLVKAVDNGEAAEGSLLANDYAQAMMIREYATKNNMPHVAHHDLHTLRRSLNVVLRRYGISRTQRADRVTEPAETTGPVS